MMKRLHNSRVTFLLSLVGLLIFSVGCPYVWFGSIPVRLIDNDRTAFVEDWGNPYRAMYPSGEFVYARNIWDMAAFEGSLYVGAGNSSNLPPARNAGPVPIFRYAPPSNVWEPVITVDDEQVDVFYEFDGQLYTPGHDPTESWDYGNYYRLEDDGVWAKHRNIPDGVHNYAMASHQGKLFAGLGLPLSAGVGVSADIGATWTNQAIPNDRIYAFLSVGHSLFATGAISTDANPEFGGVFQFDDRYGFLSRPDLGPTDLFPQQEFENGRDTKVYRPVNLGRTAIYMGAYIHNDHHADPFAVYVARSLERGEVHIRRVGLPANTRPWDLLLHQNRIYLLVEMRDGDTLTNVVLASRNLRSFVEVLRFTSSAFARSFAIMDGDFYFGLGSEIRDPENWTQSELQEDTGKIIRIKDQLGREHRTSK